MPEEPEDDVAFIATRMPPLGDHVTTAWRVTPDSLAPIRYLLRRWLMNRGASEQRAYDIIVAAQEACANAIEHASAPAAPKVAVIAENVGRPRATACPRGRRAAARGWR